MNSIKEIMDMLVPRDPNYCQNCDKEIPEDLNLCEWHADQEDAWEEVDDIIGCWKD